MPHSRPARVLRRCPAALALLLGTGLALSACEPAPRSPQVAAENPVELNSRPGPPLPAGSRLEKAGSVAPEPEEPASPGSEGSLRPDDKTPQERVPEIYRRGRLIVGVDRSNNLLSYRDSATGEVRGFEVDIAHELARDIFGDPSKVDFRFVESSERIEALRNGTVDVVVRTMTISPQRQREVEFSIPYMSTDTRMLVLSSSEIKSVHDTDGTTLCAVVGSTALDTIRRNAPGADILQTRTWGDCHMALQLNQVDGVVVDDTLLSGMVEQDSYTSIVGSALDTESYGVAVRKSDSRHDSRPLVRQVNSTLERIRRDGTWERLFQEWFGAYLAQPTLDPPVYREEPTSSTRKERTEDEPR